MTVVLKVPIRETKHLGMDSQGLENQKSNTLFSNEDSLAW
jgi:hypothetical protein